VRKFTYLVILVILFNATFATDFLINEVLIKNNKEVPVEVITSKLSLKKGENFSTDQMVEDYIRLKNETYIEEVKMFPEIMSGGINLVIDLTEAENSKELLKAEGIVPLSEAEKIDKSLIVKTIEVYGNNNISTPEILENVPIKVGSFFSKTKILDGKSKILEMGYFREVNAEVFKYNDGIFIKYTVLENPIITGIEISGNTIFTQEELTEGFSTTPGKVYNINELREDKDKLLKKYFDRGYSLASVDDIRLSDDFKLLMSVSEGIVKKIEFRKLAKKQDGQRRNPDDTKLKTRKFVLEREVELELDKPFEKSKFDQSARNIFRLGYFKNISQEFKDIEGDPDGGKTLVFLLDESKSASYTGSISYGSAVGVVGSMSVEDRNFKGNSQTLGVSYEFGNNSQEYKLSFYDPWVKGTQRLSTSWSIYKSDYTDSSSDDAYYVTKTGATFGIGKWLNRRVKVASNFKYENIIEQNSDKEETDNYYVGEITPNITYDTRNNIYDATRGEYAKYSVTLGQVIGGDQYLKNQLELRKFQQGLFDKNTMAYRLVLGAGTESLKDAQKFRVGGSSSLRGYSYSSYKGIYSIYGNIENRLVLDDNFQFVLFYDFGRAWENRTTYDKAIEEGDYTESSYPYADLLTDIKHSYGIGLRVDTPLGPLRFDYGWPIGDSDVTGGQFYFSIGQMF
jgi:outer membrane protein insertion porin family